MDKKDDVIEVPTLDGEELERISLSIYKLQEQLKAQCAENVPVQDVLWTIWRWWEENPKANAPRTLADAVWQIIFEFVKDQ